jgi:DNA (cytosine-5)-methyltransferase 1
VSKAMTFGSLFAGIGGFDLGLERAGMQCSWQVEIDDYASKVLEKHWPSVTRWRDVTTFPPDDSGNWNVDVICAGPPCQPVSVAGKRKGKSDDRWLWGECLRVVATLKPGVFVAENPTGILSDDRGRTFAAILAALGAVGYVCEWHVVSAADLGAPHRRERVWLVARQDGRLGEMQRVRTLPVRDSRNARARMRLPADRGMGELTILSPHRMADTRGEGLEGAGNKHAGAGLSGFRGGARRDETQNVSETTGSWWEAEPRVCRVANGVPDRVDRLRCLGNAIVPQVAELIGRSIIESDSKQSHAG